MWLIPTLLAGLVRPPRAALADGWLAGTAFFLVLLRWLDYTFRSYSAIPWPVTWLPILALAAYCGLYVGLMALARWLASAPGLGPGWALGGGARALGGGRVAARPPDGRLSVGTARLLAVPAALPVIQIAELGGVYAVSLLIVAVNAALAGVLALGLRRALPGAAAAGLLLLASLGFGWWILGREYGPTVDRAARFVDIALIQPSIEQTLKWDPARYTEIMAVYERLTREAARPRNGARPAAVLWPETATTIFLRGDPELLARLTQLSAELDTPLLIGSIDRLPGPRGQYLNSAFLLTGQGITAKYDKIHLVPFGEYVPLSGLIGFVRSWAEFISDFGAGETRTIFPLARGAVRHRDLLRSDFPGAVPGLRRRRRGLHEQYHQRRVVR